MTKKTFLFFVTTLFFLVHAHAQTTNIVGTIINKDEKTAVKNVVVAIVNTKDSNLVKFIRSDAEGNFELKNIKNGQYLLMTTHPLFADYIDSIVVNNNTLDLGKIMLLQKSKLLEAVIVKSGSPIRIKGDTTIYTADSFKVKQGASVEDLLRKMPGFQVGKNGEIKALGETVKNVLVDGEQFFGNDPGMVVKNLQANIVQEVQVYDKTSEQAAFSGVDDGVREKTINLKLKSNKKQGYFGKVEAGGGTPDNFNNTAMLNAFKGKRKFSAFGFMSNTGNTDLSWGDADKFNGGERDGLMSSYTDDNGNTYSYSEGNEDAGNGIPKNWNGGVHYSNKYKGDSLNVNTSYRFGKVNTPAFTNNFSRTYLPDTSWNNNSNASSFSNKQKQSFSFTIERKIDSNNTVKFTNGLGYDNVKSNGTLYAENLTNSNLFINNSTRITNANADNKKYNGQLTWSHKFKKIRRTFSTSVNANIAANDGDRFVAALNNFYKNGLVIQSDSVNQKTNNKSNAKTLTTNFVYTEPLNKNFTLNFTQNISINNNKNNRTVYKKNLAGDYDNKIDSLSNDFDFNNQSYRIGVSLNYKKKKGSASIGNAIIYTQFDQKNNSKLTNISNKNINIAPTARLNFKFAGNKNFRLNYRGYTQSPTIQQIQPVIDNTDLINVTKGNPDLKQAFNHDVYGGVSWNNPLKSSSFWSNFNFNTVTNDFINFNSIDTIGRNINKTININGNLRFSASANYYFGIGSGKKKIDIGVGGSFSSAKNIDFVNNIKSINKNLNYSLSLEVSKYEEDKFYVSLNPRVGLNHSTSSININSSRDFWTLGGNANVDIEFKQKFTFSTNADFNFRQKDKLITQNNDYIRWNASLKKYLYKKEFSLSFTINDILNQNRGYNQDFSTYKTTETYFSTLKRYALLTFGWEFTHNKKQKESKAETVVPIK